MTLSPPPRPLTSPEFAQTPSRESNQGHEPAPEPKSGHVVPPSNEELAGLDTGGLPSSGDYLRIYFGEFEALKAQDGFVDKRFPRLYVQVVRAHGKVCLDYLPYNSPVETIDYSSQRSHGLIQSSTEVHLRYTIAPRFFTILFAFERGEGINDEAFMLFQRNLCATQATIQFLENLLRFASGEPPVQELPPEPIKRYTTTREALSKDKKKACTLESVKQDQKDIRYAIDYLARVPLQDRADPKFVNDFYASRERYTSEAGALEEEEGKGHGPSVLMCSYIEKLMGKSEPYRTTDLLFFWRNPRPSTATDAYIQKLSPTNPIRFLGEPIDRCPAAKPMMPIVHPADVLASLKIQRRAQAASIAPPPPPVRTTMSTPTPIAPPPVAVPSAPSPAPPSTERIVPSPASPPVASPTPPPSQAPSPAPRGPVEFLPAVIVVNPLERALTIAQERPVFPKEVYQLYKSWEYTESTQDPDVRKLRFGRFMRGAQQFSSLLGTKIKQSTQSLNHEKHPGNRRLTEEYIDRLQTLKDEIDARIPDMEAFIASGEPSYTAR